MLRSSCSFLLLAASLSACVVAGGEDTRLFSAEGTLVSTEAVLSKAEADAGTEVQVTCMAKWSDGKTSPLADSAIEVRPSESVTIEAPRLVIDTAGTYAVTCPATGAEAKPSTLVIRAGDAARLIATITPSTLPVGERATVTCMAQDAFGNARSGDLAAIASTSISGAPVQGMQVQGLVPGAYGVRCIVGRLVSADAALTVIAGAPVRLIASLDRYEVRAGERVTVTCQAEDVGSNLVSINAEIRVDVTPASIDATGLTPATATVHHVSCALPAATLESVPVDLTVRPGLPASLHITEVIPTKPIYARNEPVELRVRMLDGYMNEVPAATIEVTATPALAALSAGNAGAVLLGNGPIPLTARVTSPTFEGRVVEDTTTVIVDGTPPEIMIDYPARAEIVAASPSQALTIRGHVTDALTSVTSISVNGQSVTPGRGGSFTAVVSPSWGINVIEAIAVDEVGNTRSLSQAFELGSRFRAASPARVNAARIDDGMMLHIGAAALDDNNADVDDLATIARLAVERIDVRSLIPSPVTNFHSDCSIPFIDITGNLRLYVDAVRYASPSFDFTPIQGGLRLRVEMTNVRVDLHTSGDVCEIGMGLSGSATASRIVCLLYTSPSPRD